MNAQAFAWFGLFAAPERLTRLQKLLSAAMAAEVAKEVDAAKALSPEALLARLHDLRDEELAAKRSAVPGVSRMPHSLLRHMLARVPR